MLNNLDPDQARQSSGLIWVQTVCQGYQQTTLVDKELRSSLNGGMCHIWDKQDYTPDGYIVPAKFGVHFLPLTKNVPKRTKLHLNEIGLTNTEFCKSQSQLRQPPISWKIRYFSTFCNTGVRLNATAMLCILCKYACTIFRG